MRSVEEHLQTVLAGVVPLDPIDLGLLDAQGCILEEDVAAPWPLPSFDNSAMDGYAVREEDVVDASPERPVTLRVIDDVPAGYRASVAVRPGSAIRIMTGAPIPDGADGIVPVEQTDGGLPQVQVRAPVAVGAHIRRKGEDVPIGARMLRRGAVVGPREIAVLAAVGRARVSVHPRPRVVVMSTGSELVELGGVPVPGMIMDSNGPTIAAAVTEAGAVAYRVGPVKDDAASLVATLEDQLVRADLVVTTGGVSAGAYDTVKTVLSRLGSVDFVKVAMRPGMPQGHGLIGPDRTPIVTLPGNPVAAYVSFEVFVRPIIRRMLGYEQLHRPIVRATVLSPMRSPAGKRQFARAVLDVQDGRYVVSPLSAQGPHMFGSLASTNALIVVPESVTAVDTGAAVAVLRLDQT